MVFLSCAKKEFSRLQPKMFPKSCRNTTAPQHSTAWAICAVPAAEGPDTVILQDSTCYTASHIDKYTFWILDFLYIIFIKNLYQSDQCLQVLT